MKPPEGTAAVCPVCGGNLDFKFMRRLDQVAAMRVNGEWVALEDIPINVVCSDHYELPCVGKSFTIDIDKATVLYGFLRPKDED